MKLRPYAAAACLAAVALFGTACGGNASPASDGSQQKGAETAVDPKAELITAFANSSKQTTMKLTMKMDEMDMKVELDKSAKKAHMTMEGKSKGNEVGMEMLISGDDVYVKYTAGELAELMKTQLNGKTWIKSDAKALGANPIDEMGRMFDSGKLFTADTKVTRNGQEFKLENGGGDVSGFLKGLTGDSADKTKADPAAAESTTVTLDAKGLVSAMTATGSKPEQNTAITFSGYGEPVDMKVPDAKDVKEQ